MWTFVGNPIILSFYFKCFNHIRCRSWSYLSGNAKTKYSTVPPKDYIQNDIIKLKAKTIRESLLKSLLKVWMKHWLRHLTNWQKRKSFSAVSQIFLSILVFFLPKFWTIQSIHNKIIMILIIIIIIIITIIIIIVLRQGRGFFMFRCVCVCVCVCV